MRKYNKNHFGHYSIPTVNFPIYGLNTTNSFNIFFYIKNPLTSTLNYKIVLYESYVSETNNWIIAMKSAV